MLACILGKPGEVFFPKLGEDQMLTFSSICDRFVTANGMEKDPCTTDEEAKRKAAALKPETWNLKSAVERAQCQTRLSIDEREQTRPEVNLETIKWPVVYFTSDTTGEKAYEEFYVPGEKIDMQRFSSLGVVEQTARHSMDEVDAFFWKLEDIFEKEDFTKAQVVEAIKSFIPNFEHEEKGKNLDQKM